MANQFVVVFKEKCHLLIAADTNYLVKPHFDLFGIVGLDDELLVFGAEDFTGQQVSIF